MAGGVERSLAVSSFRRALPVAGPGPGLFTLNFLQFRGRPWVEGMPAFGSRLSRMGLALRGALGVTPPRQEGGIRMGEEGANSRR